MPFTAQLVEAIEVASYPQLSELSHEVWKAHASGVLTDTEAQAAAERIHARRARGGRGGSK
jgi:hypothetical protein